VALFGIDIAFFLGVVSFLRPYDNRKRGFVLFLVLLFTVAIAGIAVGVFRSVQTYRRLNLKDVVGTKLVLKSSLDYVVNGIRNRWCFDDVLTPSPNCPANQDGNTERLTLPEQTLRGRLKTSQALSTIDPAPRRAIVKKVSFGQMTSQHPLKFAVAQVSDKLTEDAALCVVSRRLDKSDEYVKYLPGSNSESLAFILVRISLIAESTSCREDTETLPSIRSLLVVYPRELNEFSLVVAGDLDLSKAGTSSASAGGDLGIPSFSSPSSANAAHGVQFLSPVFVNHSLVYSNTIFGLGGSQTIYPKVSFSAPLYLGDQIKMSNGVVTAEFEPASAAPATWGDFPYSGLQKGIRVESKNDAGLDFLSGRVTSAAPPVDESKFRACLEESRRLVNRDLTVGADESKAPRVIVKQDVAPKIDSYRSAKISEFHFRVGLSQKDRFVPSTGIAPLASLMSRSTSPCIPVAEQTSCREIEVDDTKIQLSQARGFENASPVLKVEVEPQLSGSKAVVAGNLTLSSDLKIPLNVNTRDGGGTHYDNADPNVELTTEPYIVEGHRQPDQMILVVRVADFRDNMDGLLIRLRPMTLGHDDATGSWKRETEEPLAEIKFSPASVFDVVPDQFGSSTTPWRVSPLHKFDLSEVAETAMNLPDDMGTRGRLLDECLQESNWTSSTSSFSDQAKLAWDFALPDGMERATTPVISQDLDSGTDNIFLVRSIVQKCVVSSTAHRVMGFFVCEDLKIERRTEPLKFIGTMIVTKSAHIDRSAVEQGITFANIHHPSSIHELRDADVLLKPNPRAQIPWWHPNLSVDVLSEVLNGLPGILRTKAIPFQWTSVDPDCGLIPGDTQTTCDNEIQNLVVSEVGSKIEL
jgi:hypothetical protein